MIYLNFEFKYEKNKNHLPLISLSCLTISLHVNVCNVFEILRVYIKREKLQTKLNEWMGFSFMN